MPQANLGGGKVGLPIVDFHFSTAHSFSSFWSSVLVGKSLFGSGARIPGSRPQLSVRPGILTHLQRPGATSDRLLEFTVRGRDPRLVEYPADVYPALPYRVPQAASAPSLRQPIQAWDLPLLRACVRSALEDAQVPGVLIHHQHPLQLLCSQNYVAVTYQQDTWRGLEAMSPELGR